MAQPQPPFNVKAVAPYTARNNTEVSLEVGKIYQVLQTDGRGLWWQTRTEDGVGVGWFPASYTEVVQGGAPPPLPAQNAAPPQPTPTPNPTPAVTVAAQSSQPSLPTQQSVVSLPSAGESRPAAPSKKTEEKGPSAPCSVTLHLVKGRDFLPGTKVNPIAYIYKREVMQDGKQAKPLFNTLEKKKTNSPEWNEEFKLFIRDAELEVVCIRVCNGKDFKRKIVGELEFPLRGAVRKFDKPNGIFSWFPIKDTAKGKDKTGEILLFIEFEDTRATEGPKNVKHEGHVGLTAGGGFEIRDIPAEWKQLFRVLNIKKKDLEANPEMAKEVFNIMNNAAELGSSGQGPVGGGGGGGGGAAAPPPVPAAASSIPAAPTPPPAATSVAAAAPPPPPQPQVGASAPPPPPPPVAKGPAPPPPPPANAGPKPPPPPAPSGGGGGGESAPAPPPAPSGGGGGGGGGLSLFDQIKQGGVKLKKTDIAEVEKGTASTGNPLADTLINAMSKYRPAIAGNDKAEDEDDWSDE